MIIIFAQGRTGTSLLADLLESTGYFTNYNEILEYPDIRGFLRFWRRPIIKIKISQIRRYLPLSFVKRLFKTFSCFRVRFITIDRDIHDQVTSWYIAQVRGEYHKFNDSHEPVLVKIPYSEFLERVGRRKRWEKEVNDVLKVIPHIRVSYDNDLKEAYYHQKTIDMILKEMGYVRRPCHTKHRRIRNENEITIKMHNDLSY
jgi:hypothetical protein